MNSFQRNVNIIKEWKYDILMEWIYYCFTIKDSLINAKIYLIII